MLSPEHDKKPRAAIYVNKRILPVKSFPALHYASSDITMIQLKTDKVTLFMLIINIYNTKGTTLINTFATFLRTNLQHHGYDAIAMVGDFNLHHPCGIPQIITPITKKLNTLSISWQQMG